MRRSPLYLPGWFPLAAIFLSFVGVAAGFRAETSWAEEPAGGVDYERDIKPIFHERCFACHGALKQEGSLRLDTVSSMLTGGDSGPALAPKDAAASLLLERVSASEEYERMPPEGKPLTPEQIASIKAWITSGAVAPKDEKPEPDPREHWAYQAPVRAEIPQMEGGQPANPIDAFLAAERTIHNIKPVGPVEKSLLLRRVYLDLIGLPPTRAQLQAFLADEQPDAYLRVVNELLESPQYGERWGRHWMDVWRYSDWYGLGAQVRNSQKHVWHWRDWIVESLNADKGYDQMLLEMLAADELYPTDQDKLRGTGFLVRNYYLFNRTTWLDDTLEHTSKAFLGLTLNCTKCHDHKYDPVTQEEYYQMRAIFEPHQIRMDPVPGEADLEKDGLPRAFDAHADAETFIHIRGDEKNPDKSKVIPPGVPAVLGADSFEVQPVDLPPLAYKPELQPFVLADQLKMVEGEVATAEAALSKAKTDLAAAEKADAERVAAEKADAERVAAEKLAAEKLAAAGKDQPAEVDPLDAEALLDAGKVIWEDDFTAENAEIWKRGAGEWKYADGQALQSFVGAERANLRSVKQHPADFHARMKFKITGGNQWKSVGLCFDTTDEREKLVYMSAVAGGSKLQIATKSGGGHVYPANGAVARSVELNKPYELEIKVRGKLVNVAIDGAHALAFELSVAREPGHIDLITYDAAAAFDHFEIRELKPEVQLIPASAKAAAGTETASPLSLDSAKLAMNVADLALAAAKMRADVVRTAHAAEVAKGNKVGEAELKPLVEAAALAARKHELAQAKHALAAAELKKASPDDKTRAAGEAELKKADANLKKAEEAVATPGDKYPTLQVSVKAAEGPDESAASRNQPYPATSTGRRTALAKWMVQSDHPLTARVAVNHIWLRHFGQPLVDTVDDFGRRAPRPVQQPLLDWLAVELIEHGWSMKHMHRLMVTSDAYRLSTSSLGADEATAKADPENKYYWRRRPTRLESQVLRDSLLHLAGQLDLAQGGPTINPASDLTVMRRSMYFTHSRDTRSDFLTMFDDADILACYRRSESIVPQQALTLANSKLSLQMARMIAQKLQAELGQVDDAAFVVAAYETVLCARPDEEERAACLEMLTRTRKLLEEQKAAEIETRARHDLIHALLNHNDFVTIR